MNGARESLCECAPTVAALFVDPQGTYANQPGVEIWDEVRDARLYEGPWPVVAHPPCARWGSLAYINQAKYGYRIGDDGGCFAAALRAVRTFGGVLEHPALSNAWRRFVLPKPGRMGWTQKFDDAGWTTEVSQVAYGHRARKATSAAARPGHCGGTATRCRSTCACDTSEDGWRPCPSSLCERPDHPDHHEPDPPRHV